MVVADEKHLRVDVERVDVVLVDHKTLPNAHETLLAHVAEDIDELMELANRGELCPVGELYVGIVPFCLYEDNVFYRDAEHFHCVGKLEIFHLRWLIMLGIGCANELVRRECKGSASLPFSPKRSLRNV